MVVRKALAVVGILYACNIGPIFESPPIAPAAESVLTASAERTIHDEWRDLTLRIFQKELKPDDPKLLENILAEIDTRKGEFSTKTIAKPLDAPYDVKKESFNQPGRYDFFRSDRNVHPAYDFFVKDANFDCLDDRLKRPVHTVALADGIVLGTFTGWTPEGEAAQRKGGNYVWLYNPAQKRVYYYAHHDTVVVKPGDIVHAGDILGTVGRTGLNAYKRRSPTHLHLMVLDVRKGIKPVRFLEK